MSQAPSQHARTRPTPRQRLHLSGVTWTDYGRFLRLFAQHPGHRLTYDRGELEIMSPRLEHGKDGYFLGRIVDALSEELNIPIVAGGSVTIRRRRRGLEPDNCYWIANAAHVAALRRIDLKKDPPPDLAIEIDVTSSSLDRMSIYANIGVAEVWNLGGDDLPFFALQPNTTYAAVSHSLSFPLLTPADVMQFLQQARLGVGSNDSAVIAAFRAWIRQRSTSQSP